MTIIKCNAENCKNNYGGLCQLKEAEIEATEFNCDPTCYPICLSVKVKRK